MAEITFRDFAAAIMGNDSARAAEVLSELLGIDAAAGVSAGAFFQEGMKSDQSFMMKAMGLRGAVTGGTDVELGALLRDCFALTPAQIETAVVELRKRYPAQGDRE